MFLLVFFVLFSFLSPSRVDGACIDEPEYCTTQNKCSDSCGTLCGITGKQILCPPGTRCVSPRYSCEDTVTGKECKYHYENPLCVINSESGYYCGGFGLPPETCPCVIPPAPINISFIKSCGDNNVTVKWDAVNFVDRYIVYVDGTPSNPVDVPAYTFMALSGHNYSIWVKAISKTPCNQTSPASTVVSYSQKPMPLSPTNLIYSIDSNVSCSSGVVKWDQMAGVDSYLLQIDNTSNPWVGDCTKTQNPGDICISGYASTSYSLNPAVDGNTYKISVYSTNSCGNSVLPASQTVTHSCVHTITSLEYNGRSAKPSALACVITNPIDFGWTASYTDYGQTDSLLSGPGCLPGTIVGGNNIAGVLIKGADAETYRKATYKLQGVGDISNKNLSWSCNTYDRAQITPLVNYCYPTVSVPVYGEGDTVTTNFSSANYLKTARTDIVFSLWDKAAWTFESYPTSIVCENGQHVSKPMSTRMFHTIWPKDAPAAGSGLTWAYIPPSGFNTDTKSVTIGRTFNPQKYSGVYLGMEYFDGTKVTSLKLQGVSPGDWRKTGSDEVWDGSATPIGNYGGSFFNPLTPMLHMYQTKPSGKYEIKFYAPVELCPTPPILACSEMGFIINGVKSFGVAPQVKAGDKIQFVTRISAQNMSDLFFDKVRVTFNDSRSNSTTDLGLDKSVVTPSGIYETYPYPASGPITLTEGMDFTVKYTGVKLLP